jgi:alkylation response protein AidB-like acyl-CoA dehydrogenase
MEPFIFENETHKRFRQIVRDFVEKEIKPNALKWEQEEYCPVELLKKAGEKGLIGVALPRGVGGGGKDFWHEVILAEELAQSKTLGWTLSLLVQGNMIAPLIFQLGTKAQKEKVIKPALRGEFYLALAATDPSSGSDLTSISTSVKASKNGYLLNGEKCFITNGSIASYIVVLARTKTKRDAWSLGLFLVPGDARGLQRTKLTTIGLKTGDTAHLIFNNCLVPKDNALGDFTKGFLYLLRGLHRERLICAVALNSLALYIWEETLRFLQHRERFGGALSRKQVIRHRMVELRTTIEVARQFTYSVCDAFAKGKSVDKEILMLKIFSYENCQKVIDECIHLHGGEGFLTDHWLSYIRRDSQVFTLAAGTSEVVRDLLAGMLRM